MSSNTAIPADSPLLVTSDDGKTRNRTRWSRQVAVDIVGFLDAFAIIASSLLPVSIYSTFGGIEPNWVLAIQSSIAASIIVFLLMRAWGMYDPTKTHDLPENPGKILTALAIAFIVVLGLGLPHAIKDSHIWVWYAAWGSAAYTLMLLNRIVGRPLLRRLTEQGRFNKRVAVFGAGNIALRVHNQLAEKASGIEFVGVFDDRKDEDRLNSEGMDVHGKLEDLTAACRSGKIDQIIIALPQAAEGRMASITEKLSHLPVSVHIVTHISSDIVEGIENYKVSNLGPIGLLDIKKKDLGDWAPIIKRYKDFILGVVFSIIAAPVMLIIAAALKIESKGACKLFTRERVMGFDNKPIALLKFCTSECREDGTDETSPIGRILKRFHLDGLPKLYNVVQGKISLVGPRANPIDGKSHTSETFDTFALGHDVKPGITGPAQIAGEIDRDEDLDIDYVKTWSLLTDLKILAKTAWLIVIGKYAG